MKESAPLNPAGEAWSKLNHKRALMAPTLALITLNPGQSQATLAQIERMEPAAFSRQRFKRELFSNARHLITGIEHYLAGDLRGPYRQFTAGLFQSMSDVLEQDPPRYDYADAVTERLHDGTLELHTVSVRTVNAGDILEKLRAPMELLNQVAKLIQMAHSFSKALLGLEGEVKRDEEHYIGLLVRNKGSAVLAPLKASIDAKTDRAQELAGLYSESTIALAATLNSGRNPDEGLMATLERESENAGRFDFYKSIKLAIEPPHVIQYYARNAGREKELRETRAEEERAFEQQLRAMTTRHRVAKWMLAVTLAAGAFGAYHLSNP